MGIKVNRAKFWELYHKSFEALGPVTQPTVDNLNAILDKFETETRLKFIPEYSYCLATAFHEAAHGGDHFIPIKEGKGRAGSDVWERYQKKYWGTGFYGRGLVQLTFKDNYAKMGKELGVGDLYVRNPDLVLQIDHAYEIMIIGMARGLFRGHKLSDYFKDDDATLQQYVDARDIINGDKKKNGLLIAGYAEKFEHILTAAQAPQTGNGQAAPVPPVQDVVSVPPIAPATTDSVASDAAAAAPETELQKIGNKANAIYTSFGTIIAGVIAWFGSSNGTIVLGVMGCIALLGIAYMITTAIRAGQKDKRDRQERKEAADRELQLKIVREQHAQEAQIFSMKTAADPNLQAVTIGPPPEAQLPGSEQSLPSEA